MEPVLISKTNSFKKTRLALFWMNIADEPLTALFTLLLFILRKDLGASYLQLSIFATIRPVISLFSFYWSSNLSKQKNKLLSNLMSAWVLGRVPFLFFFAFNNVWFIIVSAAIYQLFHRANIPALIEIVKLNMNKDKREKLFSFVYILRFAESIFLGLYVGKILDFHPFAWKIAFVLFALLSMSSFFLQRRIELPLQKIDPKISRTSLKNKIINPWRDCFSLLRSRKDFAHFQVGFMIGGFGLMLIAPALAIYYAESLSLSHNDLTIARYIWMGAGVLLSSYYWRRKMAEASLNNLTSLIILGFAIFPFLLLLAKFHLIWLDIAFLFYGIAQAGSHLLWNLSGAIFATSDETSAKYTATNILMVGIRGAIAPVLGGFLCHYFDPYAILLSGSIICLSGAIYMLYPKRVFAKNIN